MKQEIIDKWVAHSVATGTTDENRAQATRGYRVYYDEHSMDWPGDDKVKFFPSPIAAATDLARAKLIDESGDPCYTPTDDQIESTVRSIWLSHVAGRMWPSWPAYIEYARGEMGDKFLTKFEAIIDQAQCSWWWPTDVGVWAVDNPTILKYDEDMNLHCTDGPALEYSDGYRIYMVNGVLMKPEYLNDHSNITLDVIKSEINIEVKRVLRELYGNERYLVDSGARVVDMDQVPTMPNDPDAPWIQRALMEDGEGDRWLMTGDGSTVDVYCIPVTKEASTCVEAYNMLRSHSAAGGKEIQTIMEC